MRLYEQIERKAVEFFVKNSRNQDAAHGLSHAVRVLSLAKNISSEEEVDFVVVTVAALLHDVVLYPKNSNQDHAAAKESAALAASFMEDVIGAETACTEHVKACILCSTCKSLLVPSSLEAAIVHDADILEQSGLISIARTCASSGILRRLLFHPSDPFCRERQPEPNNFGFDLVRERLLVARAHLITEKAKTIVTARENSLFQFIELFESEYKEVQAGLVRYAEEIVLDQLSHSFGKECTF